MVHLAKVTLEAAGAGGWNRNLEIDAHLASHADHPWNAGLAAPSQGIVSQFAVFHYGDQPDRAEARRQTDDAIRRFVSAFQTTDDPDRAAGMLRDEGLDADLVHRVVAFASLAFGRLVIESLGASLAPDFVRITRDGIAEEGLMLMRQPVFARSMALGREFMQGELREAVKKVAFTSSEVDVVNNALHAGGKPDDLDVFPPVIPDPGASQDAVQQAVKELIYRAEQKYAAIKKARPWWQFW